MAVFMSQAIAGPRLAKDRFLVLVNRTRLPVSGTTPDARPGLPKQSGEGSEFLDVQIFWRRQYESKKLCVIFHPE